MMKCYFSCLALVLVLCLADTAEAGRFGGRFSGRRHASCGTCDQAQTGCVNGVCPVQNTQTPERIHVPTVQLRPLQQIQTAPVPTTDEELPTTRIPQSRAIDPPPYITQDQPQMIQQERNEGRRWRILRWRR